MLARKLVSKHFPSASVGAVKYFTADVKDFGILPREAERQDLWLQALGAQKTVHIIKGFHAKQGGKQRVEKQTDTRLAISIVRDAVLPRGHERPAAFADDPYSACDGVVLISGDQDLDPALAMAIRYGTAAWKASPEDIEEQDLLDSRLPDVIETGKGKPVTW